jgi:hypothetical protein
MFHLILDTRTVDLGCTVWMSPIRTTIVDDCFSKGKTTFASAVEKNLNKINNTILKAIEAIESN